MENMKPESVCQDAYIMIFNAGYYTVSKHIGSTIYFILFFNIRERGSLFASNLGSKICFYNYLKFYMDFELDRSVYNYISKRFSSICIFRKLFL